MAISLRDTIILRHVILKVQRAGTISRYMTLVIPRILILVFRERQKMQVFISWSGERSKAVAELLDEWIQCVLQAIRPWMSTKDIDRGSLWFSEITDQLRDTKIGIVCLTKDNLYKPWILFEAGALAKGLSNSRVCTFLVDLVPADISDPLAQFNHTMPNQEGIFGLVRTLNSLLGDKALSEKTLIQVFETYWPQFEGKFSKIIKTTPTERNEPIRSEESILSEVLSTVRMLDKRVRQFEVNHGPKSNLREKDIRDFQVDLFPIAQSFRVSAVYNIAEQMLREGKSVRDTVEFIDELGIVANPRNVVEEILGHLPIEDSNSKTSKSKKGTKTNSQK